MGCSRSIQLIALSLALGCGEVGSLYDLTHPDDEGGSRVESDAGVRVDGGGSASDAGANGCADPNAVCGGQSGYHTSITCHPGTGEGSSHARPSDGSIELHVFGIYEAGSECSRCHTTMPLDLEVTRTGVPIVLVLASYESTQWRLSIGPGVEIVEIITYGYYGQHVTDADGIRVTNRGEGYAYAWPSSEAQRLVADAEGYTGARLTSFSGCYSASEASLTGSAQGSR